jgi:hypothetical protein
MAMSPWPKMLVALQPLCIHIVHEILSLTSPDNLPVNSWNMATRDVKRFTVRTWDQAPTTRTASAAQRVP